MKRSNLVVAGYLALVFLSGAAVGGLSLWLYTSRTVSATSRPRGSDHYRQQYLSEMETRLKLDDGQLKKLEVILDSTRAQFAQVRVKYRPEMDAIHAKQVEQVQVILSDSQKAEYERLRQEREERRKQWEKDREKKPGR